MADQNETVRLAHLLAAVEKHIAFLEGALGLEMTPLFNETDTGYMDDSIVFENLEAMAAFLENVVLLFRIARAQQRIM